MAQKFDERNAENMQPLRAGRDVGVAPMSLQEADRLFSCELDEWPEDPMRAWDRYLSRLRQSVFPSGHEHITRTLAQAANQFKVRAPHGTRARTYAARARAAGPEV